MKAETRQCQNCKNDFIIEPDDFGFYEKIKVPPPTFCPNCRFQRRLAWQGYQILYKRKCDFTGEEVITTHHTDSPHKIYKQEIWWSDKWDPMSYARDIDWSRPFLEQYKELLQSVPLPSLYTGYSSMIRSDYCNAATECKDCYLCFRVTNAENSAYVNLVSLLKDCIDCSYNRKDQVGYGNNLTFGGYNTFFCEDVVSSMNMYFCRSCVGCSDCIGCINLNKKKYHIFNQPYSKEEYQTILANYDFGSRNFLEEFKEKVREFFLQYPRKQFNDRSSQNTTGEYIYNSKNVHDSFMARKAEDCRYCQFIKAGPASNCYDFSLFGEGAEFVYESVWVGINISNVKFSVWNYGGSELEYCFGCHSSNNMFGSVGIRSGEYCILNKKYSKEEYLHLVEKIREQMMSMPYIDRKGRLYIYGEMMPAEMSPWAYNESAASEFFPLNEEQAISQGLPWRKPDQREYLDATFVVPDDIKDVDESILKEILKCEECGKNYKIIRMELDFYKRYSIPVPQSCSLCRDRKRTKMLNSFSIFTRNCNKCHKLIKTSWAPDRPEIVYCADCYKQEVY